MASTPSRYKEKVTNYTRNGWGRCKTTLETGGEDVKLHSKRVEKMSNYTRNGWGRCLTKLETSEEDEYTTLEMGGEDA